MRSLISIYARRLDIYECYATDWTSIGVSKPKSRLHKLIWVYTCQNATLFEIKCHGSIKLYTSTQIAVLFPKAYAKTDG